MLVAFRQAGGSTTQIFRIASPLGEPEALTDSAEPVRNASYEPIDRPHVVFERSIGGDEAAQIYRLDLATRQTTPFTEPGQRHDMQGWLHRSSALLYLSLPLDRTAGPGRRDTIKDRLTLVDPMHPESRRRLADLPGGGWSVGGVSWSDGQIALSNELSANRVAGLAARHRQRRFEAGPARGRPARQATHLAMPGSTTTRASSSSATAPASSAS